MFGLSSFSFNVATLIETKLFDLQDKLFVAIKVTVAKPSMK